MGSRKVQRLHVVVVVVVVAAVAVAEVHAALVDETGGELAVVGLGGLILAVVGAFVGAFVEVELPAQQQQQPGLVPILTWSKHPSRYVVSPLGLGLDGDSCDRAHMAPTEVPSALTVAVGNSDLENASLYVIVALVVAAVVVLVVVENGPSS